MTRAKFDGKLFIVSHYPNLEENGEEVNETSSDPGFTEKQREHQHELEAEPGTEMTGGVLSSSTSSTSFGKYSSRTSTETPTPFQYNTPPASTFKQVKWLDSPAIRTPISRSQTPGGHNEDSDTEYSTASAANNNSNSKSMTTTTNVTSTNLKTPTPRHTVTHYWQEHILLEDPVPGRRWPQAASSYKHGNDRAHTRSLPEDERYANTERHISAMELEMSLERYESEGRKSRRKRRTQSVYLPVPEHDEEEENETAEGNYAYSSSQDRTSTMKPEATRQATFRRWSDVHRLAAELERSSPTLDKTDLGRYGRLGVGK